MASALYSDERYRSLLKDYQSFYERAISAGEVIYRPDVVFKNDTEFIVVDFKTGNPSNRHLEQVSNYIAAIRPVWNLSGRGFVYYLPEGKWEPVEVSTTGQTSLF
jgi:ATP-dependent exoDNAse (exonuclease V) beta subunit